MQSIKNIARTVFEVPALISENSDGLEKFLKLVSTIAATYETVAKHIDVERVVGIVTLGGVAKKVADVISALGFFKQISRWVCPENGQKKPFWLVPQNNFLDRFILRMKTASVFFLTAVKGVELVKMFESFNLISLGKVSSTLIGRVPVFGLVKDVLVLLMTGFSMTSSVGTIVKTVPDWNAKRKKHNLWKDVSRGLARDADDDRLRTRLADKCVSKRQFHERERAKIAREIRRVCGHGILKESVADRFFANDRSIVLTRGSELHGLYNQDQLRAICDGVDAEIFGLGNDDPRKERLTRLMTKYRNALELENKWFSRLNDQNNLRGTALGYVQQKLARVVQKECNSINTEFDVQIDVPEIGNLAQLPDGFAHGQAARVNRLNIFVNARNRANPIEADNDAQRAECLAAARHIVDFREAVTSAKETNAFRKMLKTWVSVVYDVLKVAIVSFCLITAAFGLITFPWAIAILALAIVVNGWGLGRFVADNTWFKRVVADPRLEELPAVA